jgi:hypothetical protein
VPDESPGYQAVDDRRPPGRARALAASSIMVPTLLKVLMGVLRLGLKSAPVAVLLQPSLHP